MNLRIPYGKRFIGLNAEGAKITEFLPRDFPAVKNFSEVLKEKISRGLCGIAGGKKTACVIIDDNTRLPTGRMVLPELTPFLRERGVEKITVLVALGLHAPLSEEELDEIECGLDVSAVNHDADGDLVHAADFGRVKVKLNTAFMEADLRVVIGDVELHQIFGYGGGAKSLCPGISGRESISYLHSFLTHSDSGPGILERNPVQKELKKIYSSVRVDFSVQLVLNAVGKPAGVFAGGLYESFMEGVRLVDEVYKLKPAEKFDTIIASPGGFPRDTDLYQAQKVITMSSGALKEGGNLIIFSECGSGAGPVEFKKWLDMNLSEREARERAEKEFLMGLHKLFLFSHGRQNNKVYIHSSLEDNTVRKCYLEPVSLGEAKKIISWSEKAAFVPYGTTVLLEYAAE